MFCVPVADTVVLDEDEDEEDDEEDDDDDGDELEDEDNTDDVMIEFELNKLLLLLFEE